MAPGQGCWPGALPGLAGWVLGADRGYTQCRPEHFHLPVRALGYSLVMDYKAAELGRQANSQGALMVDGSFYCPAVPDDLITASSDKRAGLIDGAMYKARISARTSWRLVRRKAPDADGYHASPARPKESTPICAARCGRRPTPSARCRSCPHRQSRPRYAPSRR